MLCDNKLGIYINDVSYIFPHAYFYIHQCKGLSHLLTPYSQLVYDCRYRHLIITKRIYIHFDDKIVVELISGKARSVYGRIFHEHKLDTINHA